MTGKLSKNFHGVAIGPLSKILAVKGLFTNYGDKILPLYLSMLTCDKAYPDLKANDR